MALKHLFGLASVALTAKAQSSSTAAACPSSIAPAHGAPSVAPGFRVQVVANNLRRPRGIQFDSAGGLLVVEQGHGISRVPLTGDGACVRQNGATQVVVDDDEVRFNVLTCPLSTYNGLSRVEILAVSQSVVVLYKHAANTTSPYRRAFLNEADERKLNHGIAISEDGRTIYGSSHSNVYSWPYNAQESRVTGNSTNLIEGMGDDEGHTTRTLLLSSKVPSMLLVSRGSVGNIGKSQHAIRLLADSCALELVAASSQFRRSCLVLWLRKYSASFDVFPRSLY